MEFEGKVWKDKGSSFWIAEVSFLDLIIEDVYEGLAKKDFFAFVNLQMVLYNLNYTKPLYEVIYFGKSRVGN
jgi:hypothetical protein